MTYGTGGVAVVTVGNHPRPWASALQPDGSLVIAVFEQTIPGDSFLVRLDDAGVLDPSFGSGGIVTTPSAGFFGLQDVARQPDGKLVIVGHTTPAASWDLLVARYLDDGTLDPGFGVAGVVTTDVHGTREDAVSVTVQADGKLLVGANADTNNVLNIGSHTNAVLLRYLSNGILDPSFGVGGIRLDDTPQPRPLLRQADGAIVTATTGLLARHFGGTCGDGTPEAGEECDDGNLAGGDGCDPACCLTDTDGDGVCDSLDPCVEPLAAARPKISIRKLGATSGGGDESFALDADLTLPIAPPVDPAANGLRVIVTNTNGDEMDVTLDGGAFADPPKFGWKTSVRGTRTRWVFSDKSLGRRGFLCGVNKAVVRTDSAVPGLVKVPVKGQLGFYESLGAAPPLSALVMIDPPLATSGQCAQLTFPGPPTCTLSASGTGLSCR